MSGFRAPYRITTVYDRLKRRPELQHCKITIEELGADREEGYFPALQYDTARVWVRYMGFTINVVGRLSDGSFDYQVNAYCDDAPWDDQFWATMKGIDGMIDWIVEKFQTVPKGA